MKTVAICAACGEKKELCGSIRSDGVQQPRLCGDCLLRGLSTGDYGVNLMYWIMQLAELNDKKSLRLLKDRATSEERRRAASAHKGGRE